MRFTWPVKRTVLLVAVTVLVAMAGIAAVGSQASDRQHLAKQSRVDSSSAGEHLQRVVTNGSASTEGPSWSMSRANAANTNYLNTTGPTNPITVRWRFATDANRFSGGPVVADGTVYFVTRGNGGKLYAVDAWTGETRWTFPKPSSFGNRLAVLRNTIYVATHNGKVYALDTATGDSFWSFTTDGRPKGLTVANRTLYVASKGTAPGMTVPDGHVYALGALRGEEKWRFTTDGPTTGLAVKNGTAYVTTWLGSRVYALDAETGAVNWDVQLNGWLNAPVVANGIVYVGFQRNGDALKALDTETGNLRWKRNIQESNGIATPAVLGDTVYFTDKYLHAANATTGTDRWSARKLRGTPVLLDNLGYIRKGGALYTLDPATGEYHTRFTPAPFNNSWDRWRSPMAVLNSSLYAGVGIDEPNTRQRSDHTIFYALGTPEFNYTNLSVTPSDPEINETVNVTATVRNTGTGPGEFNATLLVNDNVTNTTTARLDPRTNTTVRFPLVFETNGTYTVGIHNLTRTIPVGKVEAAQRQTPTMDGAGSASSPTEGSAKTSTTAGSGSTTTESGTATSGTAPGFGLDVWLVGVVLFVGLLGLRRRA